MPKNIILCSDGTGNAGGNGDVSNVWRIYNAIDMSETENGTQVAMHDDGVGTQTFYLFKLLGRAFGYGLKRNVRDLYHFLIRNYEPGEQNQIYIFGFSRGAYTARVLAELISICGIIDPSGKTDEQVNREINEAFEILTESILDSSPNTTFVGRALAKLLRAIRRIELIERSEFVKTRSYPIELIQGSRDGSPYLIRFLGVWDTVSAYGFPVEWLANLWNEYIYPYKFSDRRLHPHVRKAVHALAVDEERETFRPMLFDQSPESNKGLPTDRVEQVWFPGVHANVGGGYPKDGLSYLSLNWMMDKAERSIDGVEGLKFIAPLRSEYAARINPSAKMYDSRAGLAVFYRYRPRNIVEIGRENGLVNDNSESQRIKIHPSVIQRVLARTERYAPGNIPSSAMLDGRFLPAKLTEVMNRYFDSSRGHGSRFSNVEPLIKLRMTLQKFKLLMLLLAFAVVFKNEIASWLHKVGWLADPTAITHCNDGWFAPASAYIGQFMVFVPAGEWLHQALVIPILACNPISLIFIGGSLGLWAVGYLTKHKIMKNHSGFWTTFLH